MKLGETEKLCDEQLQGDCSGTEAGRPEEGQPLEGLSESHDNAGSEPGIGAAVAVHPWLYFRVSREKKMPPNERTWAVVNLVRIETRARSRG